MKFRIVMADKDGIETSMRDAVEREVKSVWGDDALLADELDTIVRQRMRGLGEVLSQWFEGGEYLVVEVDTEANTCVVVA